MESFKPCSRYRYFEASKWGLQTKTDDQLYAFIAGTIEKP